LSCKRGDRRQNARHAKQLVAEDRRSFSNAVWEPAQAGARRPLAEWSAKAGGTWRRPTRCLPVPHDHRTVPDRQVSANGKEWRTSPAGNTRRSLAFTWRTLAGNTCRSFAPREGQGREGKGTYPRQRTPGPERPEGTESVCVLACESARWGNTFHPRPPPGKPPMPRSRGLTTTPSQELRHLTNQAWSAMPRTAAVTRRSGQPTSSDWRAAPGRRASYVKRFRSGPARPIRLKKNSVCPDFLSFSPQKNPEWSNSIPPGSVP
jgi:hypothetical protein